MTKNFQIALVVLVVLIGIFFLNKNSQSKLESTSEAIFTFDVEDIFKLLNLVISSYNLPNLFFQKQQVSYTKIKISKKTIETIKKYNEKDIILYSKLLQSKIIKNYSYKKLEKRNNKSYLYSSPYLLVNKQKTLLLNKVKIKEVEKELIKSNYKIQLV